MPNYGKDDFKESNVNYLNKDFASLKNSLINYAKSYFPNSYRDFNETSPGMMLIEMNAYVGDVLSFYIDQQYREMLLPLAEERRNIMNMAKMFGYKVKPIVPSFVNLTFRQNVNSMDDDASKVNYSAGGIFDKGLQVKGSDSSIVFETLDIIDFQISSSIDTNDIGTVNTNTGLTDTYSLKRNVKAVSGKEKTSTFTIGAPEKFKKITISDKNVIDIISVVDSNGNKWYEVDFLAQDKVPIETHYTQDDRINAYQSLSGETETTPVPYSLEFIKTSKRFTRETNVDNTTSLIFGNGVLKNGQVLDDGFLDLEQVGIVIPGQANNLNSSINPMLGDEYSTLGESPGNTTLTVTYRTGGGIDSNIPSSDLTTIVTGTVLSSNATTINDLTVTNEYPAVGGKDEETIEEIREKSKAFFTTQNRCVTKEDYEARVLNLPSKFGNIAKVYVSRNVDGDTPQESGQFANSLTQITTKAPGLVDDLQLAVNYINNGDIENYGTSPLLNILNDMQSHLDIIATNGQTLQDYFGDLTVFELSAINIYILAYTDNKNLLGNPMASYDNNVTDEIPITLLSNIKNYLNNFKILTDTVNILDGYIINFGVFFDVVSEKYANKQQVKFRCIDKIKEYFNIDKMQFSQPINISKLEYILMDIEGVRSINHITITQHQDYHPDAVDSSDNELEEATWQYSYNAELDIDDNSENGAEGGFEIIGTPGYGYFYNFQDALIGDTIRPPLASTPAVFELKNPNQNIKGRVR